jgi:hypothetical protein
MFPRGRNPRRTPNVQGNGIIAKGDANVFDQPINLLIQFLQLRLVQNIKMGNTALDIGRWDRAAHGFN